jgi:membrane protein implicated in regulation of membrane protease activity
MTILWWHWLLLGLILVLAELATAGGFYIIFFGLAALLVGGLAGLGLANSLILQLLLFSLLSVSSLALFRARLLRWLQVDQSDSVDTLVGETCIALDDLPAGGVGKVELRGSAWAARSLAAVTLPRGARCRVVRVDGLTLYVEPEGARV